MNNYEQHQKAEELEDSSSSYHLAKELVKLREERDALAASVVKLLGALELARDRIELLANIATDLGAKVYAAHDVWPEEMERVISESPLTTLDRRDARMKAEALEEMADTPFVIDPSVLVCRAAFLRQQAKENE